MTHALLQIVVAFAAIAALGSLWFGLQLFVRRFFPALAPPGQDPFRARFGCGGCHGGSCDPTETPETC